MAGWFQAAWSLDGMRQVSAGTDGHGTMEPAREEEGFSAVGDSGSLACGAGDLERRVSLQESDSSRSAQGAEAQGR